MNIRDFWQSLIEEMQSRPIISTDSDIPIVLIGHSLGGLVIKKVAIGSTQFVSLQPHIEVPILIEPSIGLCVYHILEVDHSSPISSLI